MITACFLQDCDVNLDSEVWKIEQKAPYVVITGRPGMENSQYFQCAQKPSTLCSLQPYPEGCLPRPRQMIKF